MTPPKAVLFDLDGTLVDTAPDLGGTIMEMQTARGLPCTPLHSLRPVASAGARGLLEAGFGLKPEDDSFEAMRTEFLQRYEARIVKESCLFEGFAELLKRYQTKGIAWGIVTNKNERLATLLVNGLKLNEQCAVLIGGDTTPHAKPHPEPCLAAVRSLQLHPEDCWFVGDDLRDIQAGKAAGMTTVAAGYGYCGNPEPVQTWGADIVVASVAEFSGLFMAR